MMMRASLIPPCRRHALTVLALGVAALAAQARAQPELPEVGVPLGRLIQQIETGAPAATAAGLRERAAESKLQRTWMEYLPEFKLGANALMFDGSPISIFSLYDVQQPDIIARQVEWGRFGGMSAGVSLPLWGAKAPARNLRDQRQRQLQVTQEKTTQKQREAATKAADLAMDREKVLALQSVINASLVNLTELEASWSALVKAGEATPAKLIEITDRRASMELAVARNQDQAASLSRLLGVWLEGANVPARVAPPRGDFTWAMDPNRLQMRLLENSTDLKILELELKGAQDKIDKLTVKNLPEVELGGSYAMGTSFQANHAELFTGGITVNIPITTGLRNSREIIEVRNERRAQEKDVAMQRREIEMSAIDLAYKLRSLDEAVKAKVRLVTLRESQMKETEAEISAGRRAPRLLLESRQGVLDAKAEHLGQLYDFYKLWSELQIQAGDHHNL